jgi:PAS domain-containing protein
LVVDDILLDTTMSVRKPIDITAELLLMYELSLAIGHTPDSQKTCRDFLAILVSGRHLYGASVWWLAPEQDALELVAAVPGRQGQQERLALSHPLWQLTQAGQVIKRAAELPEFNAPGVDAAGQDGIYGLYPLAGEGVLLLHAGSAQAFAFAMPDQLRTVLGKLAEALRAGLAHAALRQSEARLRESERNLLTILDNVDACIYMKDTQGRYLFANRPVRELWQAEMTDIIGFGDEKFFDASSSAAIRRNDQSVFAGGEPFRSEETNTVPATGKTAIFQKIGRAHV